MDAYLIGCSCCYYFCLIVAFFLVAWLLMETGLALIMSSMGSFYWFGAPNPPRKLSRSSSFFYFSFSILRCIFLSASSCLSFSSLSSCSLCNLIYSAILCLSNSSASANYLSSSSLCRSSSSIFSWYSLSSLIFSAFAALCFFNFSYRSSSFISNLSALIFSRLISQGSRTSL